MDELYAPIAPRAETPLHRYVRGVLSARELQKKTDEFYVQAEEAWASVPFEIQAKVLMMSPDELERMIQVISQELTYLLGN